MTVDGEGVSTGRTPRPRRPARRARRGDRRALPSTGSRRPVPARDPARVTSAAAAAPAGAGGDLAAPAPWRGPVGAGPGHRGGRRRGHRRHPVAAQPRAAPLEHLHHRRRHRGPLHDAGLLELQPPAGPAPHRLGPRLVRRLPDLHLLLRPARRPDRPGARHLLPYGLAFKWGTVPGSVLLPVAAWACGRLFRLRRPRPGGPRRGDPALPLRLHVHDLRREPVLDAGRRVRLLALGGPRRLVPRPVRPRRAHRPAPRLGRRRAGPLHPLAHRAGHVRHRRGRGPDADGAPPGPLPAPRRRVRPLGRGGAGPGARGGARPATRRVVVGVDGGRRRLAVRLVAGALRGRPALFDGDGLPERHDLRHLVVPRADLWALVLAGIAVVVAVALRSRFGILLAILGGLSAAVLIFDPQGKLYNTRFLPLWFLFVYLLVGWLFSVVAGAVARWWHRERLARWVSALRSSAGARARPRPARMVPGSVGGALVALAGALLVVATPFWVPANDLPFGITPGANQVRAWADWNYSGYEGKADYPEYRAVIDMMQQVCLEHGSGRAMWEYNADLNRFGTPEALMLLPYWTGGCIQSMEGLLFESSTTTPYHFLNQAELSVSPSEPMVGLPYGTLDVPLGIQHLQLLGVRYFMASSPAVQQAAAADPELRLIASTGPWHTDFGGEELNTTWQVYEVEDSGVVTALRNEPAVLTGVGPGQSSWLGTSATPGSVADGPSVVWYDDPARWGVELAAGGPAAWPRVSADRSGAGAGRLGAPHHGVRRVHRLGRLGPLPREPGRHPGPGQGVLLPQLAGERGRGPLAGDPQPDGGRAHQPPGQPHLRRDPGRHRWAWSAPPPGCWPWWPAPWCPGGDGGAARPPGPPGPGPGHPPRRSQPRASTAPGRPSRTANTLDIPATPRWDTLDAEVGPSRRWRGRSRGPGRRPSARHDPGDRRRGAQRPRVIAAGVAAVAALGLAACGGLGSARVIGPGATTTSSSAATAGDEHRAAERPEHRPGPEHRCVPHHHHDGAGRRRPGHGGPDRRPAQRAQRRHEPGPGRPELAQPGGPLDGRPGHRPTALGRRARRRPGRPGPAGPCCPRSPRRPGERRLPVTTTSGAPGVPGAPGTSGTRARRGPPSPSPARPIPTGAAAAGAPATCSAANLAAVPGYVSQALSGRVAQLTSLSAAVGAAADLTAADRSTLATDLASELAGIQALQAQLPSATTCQSVVAAGRAMVVNFRVYVVMTPQAHLTIAADTETTVAANLAALEPRLQAAVTVGRPVGNRRGHGPEGPRRPRSRGGRRPALVGGHLGPGARLHPRLLPGLVVRLALGPGDASGPGSGPCAGPIWTCTRSSLWCASPRPGGPGAASPLTERAPRGRASRSGRLDRSWVSRGTSSRPTTSAGWSPTSSTPRCAGRSGRRWPGSPAPDACWWPGTCGPRGSSWRRPSPRGPGARARR